ncbi:uncharacterized protein V1518DRAFT_427987 [Limtongia smithiae]|uniref:uncharacterized protein n=1 Tax=Limtongia smithiae TaxID=1125753 RepID=UPI0034CDDE1C
MLRRRYGTGFASGSGEKTVRERGGGSGRGQLQQPEHELSSTTVIAGILKRIEQRRARLELIAQQSPLYTPDAPQRAGGKRTAGKKQNEVEAKKQAAAKLLNSWGRIMTPEMLPLERIEEGDLVACGHSFGVVVRTVAQGVSRRNIVLTPSRELQMQNDTSADFVIKRFLEPDLAKGCIVELNLSKDDPLLDGVATNILTNPQPRRSETGDIDESKIDVLFAPIQVTNHMCTTLRNFERNVFDWHAKLLPHQETIHSMFSADAREPKVYSLFEISERVQTKINDIVHPSMMNVFNCALYVMLSGDNIRWQCSGGSRRYNLQLYFPIPMARVANIVKALEYARNIKGLETSDFIAKAQQLIRYYRHSAPQAGTKRHQQTHELDVAFNKIDLAIIELVKLFIVAGLGGYGDDPAVASVTARLLREVGMYEDDERMTPTLAVRFLYEIGVFGRWQNPALLNFVDAHMLANAKLLKGKAADAKLLEIRDWSDGFVSADSLTTMRHDFGDMPVFCIDSADAEEIDDGISIEAVSDGKVWVHVHIADPAALILPRGSIGLEAAKRCETIYMTDVTRPMMPTDTIVELAGLRAEKDGAPRRALTFSALISPEGDICEYDVRESYVRNVKSITYRDIDGGMDWHYTAQDLGYPTRYVPFECESAPITGTDAVLTAEDKELLELARKTGRILAKRRAVAGGVIGTFGIYNVAVPPTVSTMTWQPRNAPLYDFSQSNVELRLQKDMLVSRYLVSEFMLLGGRVAAMFAKRENISLPFRTGKVLGENFPLEFSDAGFVKMKYPQALISQESGYEVTPPGGKNEDMGLDGYVRVTSPLRRYLDMVAHWQIKAQLHGKRLPFTETEVASQVQTVRAFKAQTRHITKSSDKMWLMRFLEQQQQQQRSKSGGMKFTVAMLEDCAYPEETMGYNVDFGIMVRVVSDKPTGLKAGEFVECTEIVAIDSMAQRVVLRAPTDITDANRYGFDLDISSSAITDAAANGAQDGTTSLPPPPSSPPAAAASPPLPTATPVNTDVVVARQTPAAAAAATATVDTGVTPSMTAATIAAASAMTTPQPSSQAQSSASSPAVLSQQQHQQLAEPRAAFGIAPWQPDATVDACPICGLQFTLLFRRHHCRICGRVVCGPCSAALIPYPPGTYVLGPWQRVPAPAGTRLRTCDDCIREPDSGAAYSSFPRSPDAGAALSALYHARSSSLPGSPLSSAAASSAARRGLRALRLMTHREPASATSSTPVSSSSSIATASAAAATRRSPKSVTVESTIPRPRPASAVAPRTGFRLIRARGGDDAVPPVASSASSPDLTTVPAGTVLTTTARSAASPEIADDEVHDAGDDDEEDLCPICGFRLTSLKTENEREVHVNDCLTKATYSGSPDQARRRNRMVVYKLPKSEVGKECIICFEDFKEDDVVARLECLCVYHRKCIKAWFEKKGAGDCPIHTVHS